MEDNQTVIASEDAQKGGTSTAIEVNDPRKESATDGSSATETNETPTADQGDGEASPAPPVGSDAWYEADSAAFDEAYPDLDKEALFADGDFLAYAEGKVGAKPLADIYGGYLRLKRNILGVERTKAARAHATGSLGQAARDAEAEYYTLAEMQAMSPRYIEEHWDKVQQSLKRLK